MFTFGRAMESNRFVAESDEGVSPKRSDFPWLKGISNRENRPCQRSWVGFRYSLGHHSSRIADGAEVGLDTLKRHITIVASTRCQDIKDRAIIMESGVLASPEVLTACIHYLTLVCVGCF